MWLKFGKICMLCGWLSVNNKGKLYLVNINKVIYHTCLTCFATYNKVIEPNKKDLWLKKEILKPKRGNATMIFYLNKEEL